jgi:hypothetical protein
MAWNAKSNGKWINSKDWKVMRADTAFSSGLKQIATTGNWKS